MIGRSLARRLERLEEQVIPDDERKVWEMIVVDSDGTRTASGIRVEWPARIALRRGSKGPTSWRRLR
jgi:hypothetical protein